jgi:hypothetical protein
LYLLSRWFCSFGKGSDMAVEIPNGAVATYVGTWGHSTLGSLGGLILGTVNPTADIGAVGAELLNDGLTITSSDVAGGLGAAFGGSYTVTLTILNQSGNELDDADLVAQVADAVHMAIGTYPASAGVTAVTTASAGGTGSSQTVPTAAGQAQKSAAAASTPKTFACGDPSWGFFDAPAQWVQCLAGKGLSTLGLVFIGLLVGVVLIVAVPRRP